MACRDCARSQLAWQTQLARCGLIAPFFFFKQKTAYEMVMSDWSSDVCSSDRLDIRAIEFVWNHLTEQRDRGVAILLITTDLEEVLALSDRCYVIYRGRLTETPVEREQIGMAMGGIGRGLLD